MKWIKESEPHIKKTEKAVICSCVSASGGYGLIKLTCLRKKRTKNTTNDSRIRNENERKKKMARLNDIHKSAIFLVRRLRFLISLEWANANEIVTVAENRVTWPIDFHFQKIYENYSRQSGLPSHHAVSSTAETNRRQPFFLTLLLQYFRVAYYNGNVRKYVAFLPVPMHTSWNMWKFFVFLFFGIWTIKSKKII